MLLLLLRLCSDFSFHNFAVFDGEATCFSLVAVSLSTSVPVIYTVNEPERVNGCKSTDDRRSLVQIKAVYVMDQACRKLKRRNITKPSS